MYNQQITAGKSWTQGQHRGPHPGCPGTGPKHQSNRGSDLPHQTRPKDWLIKYGYLPRSDRSTGQLQAWTAVTDAVKAMQTFAGLKDSGVLDEETLVLMKSPRCSLPDQDGPSKLLVLQQGKEIRRRRRSVSMWTHRNINWRLQSYPSSSHLSREMIRSLVFYALRVWAEPTSLEFHEVGSPEVADLQVDFLQGYHGDGYPFDGAGGAVGHAFFPSDPARAGGVHLDAEEQWAFRQPAYEGTDLFTVLVHEFGHALGLAHSSSRHSVMRPYYQGPVGDPLHYRLEQQDLEHITHIYGRNKPEPNEEKLHSASIPPINRCNTSFDAVAKIRGETFFFKGLMVWRVNGGGLVSGRGAAVRRLWRGLPADLLRLDAVLERHSDHAIIFISGTQHHFNMFTCAVFCPDPVPDIWTDLLKSVFVIAICINISWFFITFSQSYLEPLWEVQRATGLWLSCDKMLKGSAGSVYLFRGDSYWKFMFPGSAPQDGYPRSSAADWLDCIDSSSPSAVDDFSLSLSPPAGRQELQETQREDGQDGDVGGNRRDRHRHTPKYRQDSETHIWTQCTCQSKAPGGSKASGLLVCLLVTLCLTRL
uniref:Peptidase metallopeptidase domain-containing protein n=1 Tax=Poecilia mexicana TaxID=48701 RepID=A0A3B3XJI2_9TELE